MGRRWDGRRLRGAWISLRGASTPLRCALLIAVLVLGSAAAQGDSTAPPPSLPALTLDTLEGERTYRVYAPTSSASEVAPPPLILVLHGHGADGAAIAETTAFVRLAEREGVVIAFPDALRGAWNYVRGIPGYPEGHDDAAFLVELARTLQREHGADPGRTLLVGYSNGGFMAQRLLCEAPETFAGAVVVSAAGFAGLESLCPSGPPRSLALIHGTADDNVPWDGIPVEVPGGRVLITWPVPTTFAWWAERTACELPADRTELPGDPTLGVRAVTRIALERCAGGHAVTLYGLLGGGHRWPRGASFDAAREAWRFLENVSNETQQSPTR